MKIIPGWAPRDWNEKQPNIALGLRVRVIVRSTLRNREDRWIGASVGAVVAVVAAGLLGAARDHVGSTSSALVLAIVVVFAASVGGRLAGVVTSVAAALSFNFFLIPPYYTLRIDAGSDVVAVLLLAFIGVVVGRGAERRSLVGERAVDDAAAIDALTRMATRVTDGRSRSELWDELHATLGLLVGATDVRLIDGLDDIHLSTIPSLNADGGLWFPRTESRGPVVRQLRYTSKGLSIASSEILIVGSPASARQSTGVVLTIDPEVGSTIGRRAAAVALVRLWASASASSTEQEGRSGPGSAGPSGADRRPDFGH